MNLSNSFSPDTKNFASNFDSSVTPLSDIEECEDGLDNCDSNATCMNTVGSFTCTCNEGFSGNGVMCSGLWLLGGGGVANSPQRWKCKRNRGHVVMVKSYVGVCVSRLRAAC